MPTTSVQKIVSQKFYSELASPISITAATWGPTSGHFLIQPLGADVKAGIELERISILLQNNSANPAVTPITSVELMVAIDPAGIGVLWYGTGTIMPVAGGTDKYVFIYPKQIMASSAIPDAIQTILSTGEGQFYILLKCDVDAGIKLLTADYSNPIIQYP